MADSYCRDRDAPSEPAPLSLDPSRHTAKLDIESGARITPARFRRVLLSAALSKASDVTLQTDAQPRIEIAGSLFKLTGRPWSGTEIEDVLAESYGAASGATEIRGRKTLDYSYDILSGPAARRRFRVNATGIHGLGGVGIELTFRVLPDEPPDIADVGLTPEEVGFMTPRSGLVICAGATGSGKSSTLAALTRRHLENTERPVKIVDIQAPIEFTFGGHGSGAETASVIGQSEVGRHLPDFAAGIRSALRRKPHIIIVGEARDHETISAALEAALTGHLVYTTAHASSVHDCVRRLLAAFPAAERDHRASDLGACLRFVAAQQLLPRPSGAGRVAAREWMTFSRGADEVILSTPSQNWPQFILDCMAGRGKGRPFHDDTRTYGRSALELLRRSLITEATYAAFIRQNRPGTAE